MRTALQLTTLLQVAHLAFAVAPRHRDHDELHNFAEADHHGHSHGEQIPMGYVKYPWLSPESHVRYPGDDDGMLLLYVSFLMSNTCFFFFSFQ